MENKRIASFPIDPIFIERYSPRKFSGKQIESSTLMSLFEAARWAPSSFNEQPWRFIYATEEDEKNKFLSILTESNREWASTAPVLLFLLASKHYSKNGKSNPTCEFDAGSAWMSFTIQARKLGLYTHGMSGFDSAKAYEVLGIPEEEFRVICAIAVGYSDEENPVYNERRPVEESIFKGNFQRSQELA